MNTTIIKEEINLVKIDNNFNLHALGATFTITGKCNLRCQHCFVFTENENVISEMQDIDIINSLKEILKYGITSISITGGEPLLRRNLVIKMLEVIQAYPNVKVNLATNGFYLDDEILSYFSSISNNKTIQISIDGAYESHHDTLRKHKGSWEIAVKACVKVLEYKIDLVISHTINTYNIDAVEDIFKLAIVLRAKDLIVAPALPLGNSLLCKNDGVILEYTKRINVYNTALDLRVKYSKFFNTIVVSPGGTSDYIHFIKDRINWLTIEPNGDVLLSAQLPYVVTNIKKYPIEQTWDLVCKASRCKRVMTEIKENLESEVEMSNLDRVYLELEEIHEKYQL